MTRNLLAAAISVTATLWSASIAAQTNDSPTAHHDSAAASSTNQAWVDGEVRKVDAEQGKVTLKHGDITNLGMPAMTVVFKAAGPSMLDGLKPGDKVKFTADRVAGALAVTAIQKQ